MGLEAGFEVQRVKLLTIDTLASLIRVLVQGPAALLLTQTLLNSPGFLTPTWEAQIEVLGFWLLPGPGMTVAVI